MKKTNLLKYYGIMCAGSFLLSSPCFAVWPTLDIAKVTNAVQSATTTAEGTLQLTNATTALTSLQQSIGDNVGSLSKFQDKAEKLKKESEQLEKVRKRAERLQKLRQKYEDAKQLAESKINEAKQYAEDVKDKVDEVKQTAEDVTNQVDEVKQAAEDVYKEGTSQYENVKEGYEAAKEAYSDYKESAQGFLKGSNNNASLEQPSVLGNQEVFTIDEEALENESFSDEDLDEVDEFSQDAWDLQEGLETEDMRTPQVQPTVLQNIGMRRKFEGSSVSSVKDLQVIDDKSMVVKETVAPQVTTKIPEGELTETTANTQDIKLPVQRVDTKSSLITQKKASAVTAVVPEMKTSTVPARRKFDGSKRQAVEKNKVNNVVKEPLNVLKTSSTEESFKYSTINAFAQQVSTSSSGFKTGTTDSGNFIFSDMIATKCGLDLSGKIEDVRKNINQESIDKCLQIWILGLNDSNQTIKSGWVSDHLKALHDHVSADLAKALENKTYSATFDATVVADLDNKSQTLTTERDEISFSGEVNRANQVILLKLMQALASQVITDSFRDVKSISPSDIDISVNTGETK